jgi:indolepyruvate ferredoxin oxidoreductase beta subunit
MTTTTNFHQVTPIKIAILAMGGQGGGVLADWIVEMAEHTGWWAQTTSVPGVAQRTGATIYYLEILPEEAVKQAGRQPALALMPTPGDVDIVIAAELMESGRAIQRGLLSPDRTLLISSSHRSFAVTEKSAPGNGIADPNKVLDAARQCTKRFLCFDMQDMAERVGSVISASLFGALAGSGALPFKREDFEATIQRGGKGIQASLKAFELGFDAAQKAPEMPAPIDTARPVGDVPETARHPRVKQMLDDIRQNFAAVAQPMLVAGLRRTIEFQDLAYGKEYMEHMRGIHALDKQYGGDAKGWALTQAAARYVAVAMAYDDVIRVADLKIRDSRFKRVRDEVRAKPDQLVYTTEYMHPRLEEICGTLPTFLGKFIENSSWLNRCLQPLFRKGRFISSTSLTGFLMLYALSGMRHFRRSTLRHKVEMAGFHEWLNLVTQTAPNNYELAVEIVNCRRLVKGYSDTHARGQSKYQKLIQAARNLSGHPDAAQRLKQLRDAALADEKGTKLDNLLQKGDAAFA